MAQNPIYLPMIRLALYPEANCSHLFLPRNNRSPCNIANQLVFSAGQITFRAPLIRLVDRRQLQLKALSNRDSRLVDWLRLIQPNRHR